jgi:diguanylate cyclase (GGDEF)-like protein/PAS domain S-box-containing protein
MTNPAATILIVDDEILNRKLLEALLRPEGHWTISAASGEEALAAVAEHSPDLILLDVMMPGMDGYQVAKILKGKPATSHIPIIMVTTLTDRGARLAGLDAGAEEFLTKPVERSELWLRVRNLLRLKAFADFLQNHKAILEEEVRLRTSDLQRFRTAMDATADAIFLVNRASMRFVEINETACAMLGYTREELFEAGPARIGAVAPEELAAEYDSIIAGRGADGILETRLRRKDGSEIQVETRRNAHRSGDGWIIVSVVRDVTAEKRLHRMAHYDALTGLPNRTLFHTALQRAVTQARENGLHVALMCMDVDGFKRVNDTLGHAIGDELLVQLSSRLVKCLRASDTIGRLGGDEFALILAMRNAPAAASAVARKIQDTLRAPFNLKGHEVTAAASIGIAMYPDDAADPETLLQHADIAMYRAKQAGRDTFRFFTPQMNADMLARLDLETALRKALDNGEFLLHYQPKVRLDSGRISGVEALLRWDRPGHGLLMPNDFVPMLEETGLIVRVGAWVIDAACRQIGLWARSPIGPLQVSVNISGRQLVEGDLEGDVAKALADNRVTADLLELELTEGSLMANTERTVALMRGLKKRGVHISIDDFGTGYCGLSYLRHFPINKLKIDITFVRDVTTDPDAAAIALAIIRMAHGLKHEVIAEGVETQAQLAYLRRQGCDHVQGHHFSAPVPLAELERMLRDGKCLLPDTGPGEAPKTLLVVDDDQDVLFQLKHQLREDGYRILWALSATEAFELLALNEVQVVMCDQRMAPMSGDVFLDRVKGLYPDTFRIVLSGGIDPDVIMDAINRGSVHRFYKKPWDSRMLRDNLRDAFRQHSLLHDNSSQAREAGRGEARMAEATGMEAD